MGLSAIFRNPRNLLPRVYRLPITHKQDGVPPSIAELIYPHYNSGFLTGRRPMHYLKALATAIWAISIPVSSSAQSASTLVAADPSKAYYALKRNFQEFYSQGILSSNIGKSSDRQQYDLITCSAGGDFVGDWVASQSLFLPLADLATKIVIWRNDLPRLGFAENVWRPLLIQFEEAQVAKILHGGQPDDQDFLDQLARTLNQYRLQGNPQLPIVVLKGGCGAGEIEIKVQLNPPDGEVLFMPKLLYRFCRTLNIDPDNPQACDHWRRAADGTLYHVAGDYRFWARWPDGATLRGDVDFSKYREGEQISFTKPR